MKKYVREGTKLLLVFQQLSQVFGRVLRMRTGAARRTVTTVVTAATALTGRRPVQAAGVVAFRFGFDRTTTDQSQTGERTVGQDAAASAAVTQHE